MTREVFPGITVDPQVVHGRPVVAGTRVPVEVVLGELAGGSTFDDAMRAYHLTVEQVRAALAYATSVLALQRPSSFQADTKPPLGYLYVGDSQCERNRRMLPRPTRPPSPITTPR